MMSIFNYRIEQINTSQFDIQYVENLDNLGFATSYQFKINKEEHLVACISQYTYKQGERNVMQLILECIFKIEDESFDSLIKEKTMTIPKDILQYMATIAVGAARGEIHARCELAGSLLQDVVLPPVNLTKIITTPAQFSIA